MIMENPMPGIDQDPEPIKLGKIESWMVDFVKERHPEAEWESFFVYCQAGPVVRFFIQIGWILQSFLQRER